MPRMPIALCALLLAGCDRKTEPEVKADLAKPNVSVSTLVASETSTSATAATLASVGASVSASGTEGGLLGVGSVPPLGLGGLGLRATTGEGFGVGGSGFGGVRAASGIQMKERDVTVGPGLPPEVIRRIVRRNFFRLRVCYDRYLKIHPKTATASAVSFEIDSKGNVNKLVSKSGGDKDLDTCVSKAFAGFSFPPPDGVPSTKVTYGVDFTWVEPPAAVPSAVKP